jgi:hypothetical protein
MSHFIISLKRPRYIRSINNKNVIHSVLWVRNRNAIRYSHYIDWRINNSNENNKGRDLAAARCASPWKIAESQTYPIQIMIWIGTSSNVHHILLIRHLALVSSRSHIRLFAENWIICQLNQRFDRSGFLFEWDNIFVHGLQKDLLWRWMHLAENRPLKSQDLYLIE